MSKKLSMTMVAERLQAAGCVAALDEATELVGEAPNGDVLEQWIRRREKGEPLAWITGMQLFCERRVEVHPGVYVPRPQTEELARRAGNLLPVGGIAADLCTGAGAIASHLMAEVPSASVLGVDIDERAVRCARSNRVHVIRGDLDQPLRPGIFDIVTAVAPYVPTGELGMLPADVQRYEPRRALDGGRDGLHVVRRIVESGARLLRCGGWLLIEIGGDQDTALRSDLSRMSFGQLTTWSDADGDLRGLAARAGAA